MTLKLKNVISDQTKDRLLWCLAVQAQGPVGALQFATPAMNVQANVARAHRQNHTVSAGATVKPLSC